MIIFWNGLFVTAASLHSLRNAVYMEQMLYKQTVFLLISATMKQAQQIKKQEIFVLKKRKSCLRGAKKAHGGECAQNKEKMSGFAGFQRLVAFFG